MGQKEQTPETRKKNPYFGFLWVILIVLFLNGLIFPLFTRQQIVTTDYGSFIAKVDSGLVKDVVIKDNQIISPPRRATRPWPTRPVKPTTRNW